MTGVTAGSRPRLRAASFAAVAVPVTSVAHLAAGGGSPAPAVLVLVAALGYGLHRFVLGASDRSVLPVVAALATIQVLGHLLLQVADSGGGHHHAAPVLHADVRMLLSHLIASAVLGLLLQRNEAALWLAARRGAWSRGRSRVWSVLTSPRCHLTAADGLAARPRVVAHEHHLVVAEHLALRRTWREWTGGRVRRGPPAALRLCA